mmetsp:Transcript_9700/g.24250  ORF Transcript_9700/g.24250 Transcript_9700/m.24250 type:complete len:142 (+) Transcript_9700:323-748(+)
MEENNGGDDDEKDNLWNDLKRKGIILDGDRKAKRKAAPPKPKKAKTTSEKTEGPKKVGFQKERVLSPGLAEIIGKEKANPKEVRAFLHEYFKTNCTKDPKNRQYILLDDRLQSVFKVKKTTYFKLSSLLTKQMYDAEDVVS